jgi:hypothetical protein
MPSIVMLVLAYAGKGYKAYQPIAVNWAETGLVMSAERSMWWLLWGMGLPPT